jgi:hypothetical protein
MDIIIATSEKREIITTPYLPRIWRGLVYHTGQDLAGHTSFNRELLTISALTIDGILAVRVATIAALQAYTGANTAWTQIGAYVYVRFFTEAETASYASAQDWLFTVKLAMAEKAFTSGKFFIDADGKDIRYAVISKYVYKFSSNINEYSQIKFSTLSVQLLHRYISDADKLLGTLLTVKDRSGHNLDSFYVQNVRANIDTVKLECKDIRSAFSSTVVSQQYVKSDYLSPSGNVVIDDDTAKKYKAEAVGFCYNVPGDCLNGRAADSMNQRRYRFAYGKITIDKVEIEIENGWRLLGSGAKDTDNKYWTETLEETLPSGEVVETDLVCITNFTAHPPQEGFTIPDVESTPRKVRVTGLFKSGSLTAIFDYFMNKYSAVPYTNDYFNKAEIATELAPINANAIGLYINKPTDLWRVLAELQNGGNCGWALHIYNGLITARRDDYDRPATKAIPAYDIVNLSELEVDADGDNYATTIIVKYAKNNDDGAYVEYTDAEREKAILIDRLVPKRLEIETLLREESLTANAGVVRRYNRQAYSSITIRSKIEGVRLRRFEAYKSMRIYEIVTIDFKDLTAHDRWCITGLEVDYKEESVVIDVKEL